MTDDPLPRARDLDELHLFLDLRGWAADRRHQLRVIPGGLAVVYTGEDRAGRPARAVFATLPDHPPPGPSQLIDAGEWHGLAARLARTVPGRREALDPPARARLAQALAYLEEALRFAPPGGDRLPRSAFWTRESLAAYDARPGAYDVAMLQAERTAWRRLLDT